MANNTSSSTLTINSEVTTTIPMSGGLLTSSGEPLAPAVTNRSNRILALSFFIVGLILIIFGILSLVSFAPFIGNFAACTTAVICFALGSVCLSLCLLALIPRKQTYDEQKYMHDINKKYQVLHQKYYLYQSQIREINQKLINTGQSIDSHVREIEETEQAIKDSISNHTQDLDQNSSMVTQHHQDWETTKGLLSETYKQFHSMNDRLEDAIHSVFIENDVTCLSEIQEILLKLKMQIGSTVSELENKMSNIKATLSQHTKPKLSSEQQELKDLNSQEIKQITKLIEQLLRKRDFIIEKTFLLILLNKLSHEKLSLEKELLLLKETISDLKLETDTLNDTVTALEEQLSSLSITIPPYNKPTPIPDKKLFPEIVQNKSLIPSWLHIHKPTKRKGSIIDSSHSRSSSLSNLSPSSSSATEGGGGSSTLPRDLLSKSSASSPSLKRFTSIFTRKGSSASVKNLSSNDIHEESSQENQNKDTTDQGNTEEEESTTPPSSPTLSRTLSNASSKSTSSSESS